MSEPKLQLKLSLYFDLPQKAATVTGRSFFVEARNESRQRKKLHLRRILMQDFPAGF
ncbi:uncharacterized protein METZ01_LOCUS129083 [marine metagenome]|uniref:Uncharacterized protein n=1 Tax=marine metagenome TaxID=408172 RepID=A0A381YGR5_9ZZZZ